MCLWTGFTEPRPLSILSVSSQTTTLTKEALILKTDENLKPEMQTESKIFQNAVSKEEKSTVNKNCCLLEVSEQDFAVQIQEVQEQFCLCSYHTA